MFKEYNIEFISYQSERGQAIIKFWKLEKHCNKNDGFTLYANGWYILYDNNISPRSRIRFTLAHEVAHILLGDEMKTKIVGSFRGKYTKENKDKVTNDPIESEANIFAASLMAPACVL